MRKLYHQIKAQNDIKEIWLYSFREHGEEQADKYYDELIVGMKSIEINPYIGVACDYIRSGYRQYQINHHCIFYRLTDKRINIIRVLHEKMKFKEHL